MGKKRHTEERSGWLRDLLQSWVWMVSYADGCHPSCMIYGGDAVLMWGRNGDDYVDVQKKKGTKG